MNRCIESALLLFFVAGAAASQVQRPIGKRSGSTATDAAAIVVGELTGTTASDSGTEVRRTGILRVERVIKGDLAAGAEIPLEWRYAPWRFESVKVTTSTRNVYGMWFLAKTEDDRLEPVRVVRQGAHFGGVVLFATRTWPSGVFAYSASDPTGVKLARELGAAVEAMGMRVRGQSREPLHTAQSTRSNPDIDTFVDLLAALDYGVTGPVYAALSVSQSSDARVVGLTGRIRNGDVRALSEVEADTATLAESLGARELIHAIGSVNLQRSPELLDVIGRLALSETALPALESHAASQLGFSGRREAIPYLAAMLDSPESGVRQAAVMGLCTLSGMRRRPASGPAAGESVQEFLQRMRRLQDMCPTMVPFPDPAKESEIADYWRQWSQRTQQELSQSVRFASVRGPARYYAHASAAPGEVSPETRFVMFLRTFERMGGASSGGRAGDFSSSAPAGLDLSPVDSEALRDIARFVSERTSVLNAKVQTLLNEDRVQRRPALRADVQALTAERRSLAKQAFERMERELSDQGRATVLKRMEGMAVLEMSLPQH